MVVARYMILLTNTKRRPLRGYKWWLGLGWLFVVAVIYVSLTPSPPTLGVEGEDKLGHFSTYLLLTLWFAQLYERRAHLWWALAWLGLGVALEIVQGMTAYRSFEYADMLANSSGVLFGWLLGGTPCALLLQRAEKSILMRK